MLDACWEDALVHICGFLTGKTTQAVPSIIDSLGPVITTANKRDFSGPARDPRAEIGVVWVFDPQGLAKEAGALPEAITAPDRQREDIFGTAQQMASCLKGEGCPWINSPGPDSDRLQINSSAFVRGKCTYYVKRRRRRRRRCRCTCPCWPATPLHGLLQ